MKYEKYYQIHHVITLEDGKKMSLNEYLEHRGPINWVDELPVRIVNCIKNNFDGADLNNPADLDLIAKYNWRRAPNCGPHSYSLLMGYIEKYWPWQERHGDGKFEGTFAAMSKEHAARNKKIYQDRLKGYTYKQLGIKYELSPERVRDLFLKAKRYGNFFLNPHGYND